MDTLRTTARRSQHGCVTANPVDIVGAGKRTAPPNRARTATRTRDHHLRMPVCAQAHREDAYPLRQPDIFNTATAVNSRLQRW
jgi:hypothetical protein